MFQTTYRGIEISNVPIINQWNRFVRYFDWVVETPGLERALRAGQAPVTPYETWYGMPDELVSTILRRCFTGLEAYVRSAVHLAAGYTGQLDNGVRHAIRNPFALDRKTVKALYHKLPGQVDNRLSLLASDAGLYQETTTLYSGLRNPLFHGFDVSVSGTPIEAIRDVMRHLLRLYAWIENWPLEKWGDAKEGWLPGNKIHGPPLIFRTALRPPGGTEDA